MQVQKGSNLVQLLQICWHVHPIHVDVQEAEYHLTGLPGDIYPDFVMMAKSCGVPGSRIFRPEELRAAIRYQTSHQCFC